MLRAALDRLHRDRCFTKLVQGYARGADLMAHHWALSRRIVSTGNQYQITPDMWATRGRSAGYLRNKQMRDEQHPDLVVAFPGKEGTKMMVDLAHEARIDYVCVDKYGDLIWKLF